MADNAFVKLSDLAIRITKGTTPTTLGRPFVSEGINFVKSEAIKDGRIDPAAFGFIDSETHEILRRSQLQEGDVLFSMAGVYLGKTAVVPRSILPANTNQAVGIIRLDRTIADPRFIHYALSSAATRSWVRRSGAQSAQPNFNLAEIGRLLIPDLPLKEQAEIAGILGELDDKIELNRRTSSNLEAMARALFKSWFVDFDPVRAKAEGRDTHLPPEISAVFPNSFEDPEVGHVPKGWVVRSLPEVVELNPARSLAGVTEALYLDMANVPTSGYAIGKTAPRVVSSGSRFKNGDTLLARITPCLENGKTAFVDFLDGDQVGWGSTEFIVLRPRAPLPPEFGYLLARNECFRSFAVAKMTGSSGRQRVPVDALTSFLVAQPPDVVAQAFSSIVQPIFKRISAAYRESRTLAEVRDALLPKLISGEIPVADAQRIVAKSA